MPTEPIDDAMIDELLKICESATPGPWLLWDSNSWRRIGRADQTTIVVEPITQREGHPDLQFRHDADAELIVAAGSFFRSALLAFKAEREKNAAAITVVDSWLWNIEHEQDVPRSTMASLKAIRSKL